jgi:hypothetical protein
MPAGMISEANRRKAAALRPEIDPEGVSCAYEIRSFQNFLSSENLPQRVEIFRHVGVGS